MKIHAAGFCIREGRNFRFRKAFLRSEKNAGAVDDLIRILKEEGVYQIGNVAISLSGIADLTRFEEKLNEWPHDGALRLIEEARKASTNFDNYIIYIMGEDIIACEAEAALMRAI